MKRILTPECILYYAIACRTDSADVRLNHKGQEYLWVSLEDTLDLPVEPYSKSVIEEYVKDSVKNKGWRM